MPPHFEREDTCRWSRLPRGSLSRTVHHLLGRVHCRPFAARISTAAIGSPRGTRRPKGGILIGVDLKKDVKILEQAYNDRLGISAAFNLNILERLNRELDADHLRWFQHQAFYKTWTNRDTARELARSRCLYQRRGYPVASV